MLRKALYTALFAAPLVLGVSCEDKKKALPPVKPVPAAPTPAGASAAPAPGGSGGDRRVQAATKALQQAASRRQKQLDSVGK